MGTAREHAGSIVDPPAATAPPAEHPVSGRSNATLARQLSAPAAPVTFRGAAPKLARQDKPDPATRLKHLNGESMEQIINLIGQMSADERSELAKAAPSGPERVALAFTAFGAKGTKAAAFALAHRDEMSSLGGMDQRNAILKLVDPKFKPPPLLAYGDKLMDGKAIVHALHLRVARGAR